MAETSFDDRSKRFSQSTVLTQPRNTQMALHERVKEFSPSDVEIKHRLNFAGNQSKDARGCGWGGGCRWGRGWGWVGLSI